MLKLTTILMEIEAPNIEYHRSHQGNQAFSSDFINFIKFVENGNKSGFDKKNNLWFPHASPEGGLPTIAYGHKIKDKAELEKFKKGITDSDAGKLLEKDLVAAKQKVYDYIHRKYKVKLQLTPKQEEMLIEFTFNLGSLDKFPKFTDAVLRNQLDTVKKEYIRSFVDTTGNRRELKQRNTEFYKRYLKENAHPAHGDDSISIKDFETMASKTSFSEKRYYEFVIDMYSSQDVEDSQAMKRYIDMLNVVYSDMKSIIQKLNFPFVDWKYLKRYLIGHREELSMDKTTFYPFPVYVSANPSDDGMGTIGIIVDENGKVLEIHEGNDEAEASTINLVNKMLNPTGKKVRIYGSHDTQLIFKIDETGYLPSNLYISPDRQHASGHLDLKGDRSMFTGIIDINDISQESSVDWKTLQKTKIEKMQWL